MSRWLADACALIDFYTSDPTMPRRVQTLLEDDVENVAVVATTVWEIGIKTERGKLPDIRGAGHATLSEMLQAHGFKLLPFDPLSAEHAACLPPFHADPFDRALVVVAQRTGRGILTYDAAIGRYGVPVHW